MNYRFFSIPLSSFMMCSHYSITRIQCTINTATENMVPPPETLPLCATLAAMHIN